MNRLRFIRIIGFSLLTIVTILYYKPLLHLTAWLSLTYWIIKFIVRLLRLFSSVLLFILIIFILLH